MNWSHFMNNFLYILLIGPMLEEKYQLLGASGMVFMFIILSSLVNLQSGKIPITLILIFIFYIANEIIAGIFKKDNVSHLGHIIGAICGCIYGFYIL